jgi:hypothetical protein
VPQCRGSVRGIARDGAPSAHEGPIECEIAPPRGVLALLAGGPGAGGARSASPQPSLAAGAPGRSRHAFHPRRRRHGGLA